MNLKLIRNAMFITIIIMVISVIGKTSAHDVPLTCYLNNISAILQVILAR